MKPSDLTSFRKANLTDALRFLASLCIVLYHGNYYYLLGPEKWWIDSVRIPLIYWALPFFYITTAKHSLHSALKVHTVAQRLKKIRRIILLLVLMCVLHEIPRLAMVYQGRVPEYFPFMLLSKGDTLGDLTSNALQVLLSGNNSIAYFLSHTLIIYLLALGISWMVRRYHLSTVIGVLLVLLLGTQFFNQTQIIISKIDAFLLMHKLDAVILFISSFAVVLLSPVISVAPVLNTRTFIFITILLCSLVGIPAYVFHHSSKVAVETFFLIVSSILIIFLTDRYNLKTIYPSFIDQLSIWGQKYSLGIFLFHPFYLMTLYHSVPSLFQFLGFSGKVSIYLTIQFATIVLAILTIRLTYNRLSWLYRLS